jgi:hypothetical protein
MPGTPKAVTSRKVPRLTASAFVSGNHPSAALVRGDTDQSGGSALVPPSASPGGQHISALARGNLARLSTRQPRVAAIRSNITARVHLWPELGEQIAPAC